MTTIKASDACEVQPDEVRCMRCSRLSYISPEFRGRRLRCSRCGGFGLNLTTINPDPGNPMRLQAEARKRRAENPEPAQPDGDTLAALFLFAFVV